MKREDHATRISTRRYLWIKQDGICPFCKRKIPYEKASLDHVIPVEKMDTISHPDNLLMVCKSCNKSKGNHIVFLNLYDGEYYPMIDHQYIYQDYYIHNTKKLTRN